MTNRDNDIERVLAYELKDLRVVIRDNISYAKTLLDRTERALKKLEILSRSLENHFNKEED